MSVLGAVSVHGGTAHAAAREAAGTLGFGDGSETYRGYRIAMAQDVPNAEIGTLRRAAEHQVDLVEAAILDDATKAFLRRTQPVHVASLERLFGLPRGAAARP